MTEQNLTLQEQTILLCVDGKSGEFRQPYLQYALAGAALAELLRRRRVQLEDDRVRVRQTDPTGDAAIDAGLRRFAVTDRPRKLAWWIRHYYRSEDQPRELLADRLVERGILSRDERRALWVIRWHVYPVLEPAYRLKLRRQIRDAVMQDSPVEAELATLIAVLHHSRALDTVLDAGEIADREHRIAAIGAAYPIPYTVGKAIAAAIREEEAQRREAERAARIIIIGPGPRHPRKRRQRPWKPIFPGPPPEDENTPQATSG